MDTLQLFTKKVELFYQAQYLALICDYNDQYLPEQVLFFVSSLRTIYLLKQKKKKTDEHK